MFCVPLIFTPRLLVQWASENKNLCLLGSDEVHIEVPWPKVKEGQNITLRCVYNSSKATAKTTTTTTATATAKTDLDVSNATNLTNSTLTNNATAERTLDFSYLWTFNGQEKLGEDEENLTLYHITWDVTGAYKCGVVLSNSTTLWSPDQQITVLCKYFKLLDPELISNWAREVLRE